MAPRSDVALVPALTALLAVAVSSSAFAVDGVIEINQARALAGGVTAGDGAGFPVLIDASGSYRLTGNLTVDENTTAIEVGSAALEVDIDLNGFAILGPATCTAPPAVTCSPSGSGFGIHKSSGSGRLRVAGGAVRGMGSEGISLASTGTILVVEAVEVTHNSTGIDTVGACILDHVMATRNHAYGVACNVSSTVRHSTVSYNGGTGLYGGPGSVIEDNQVVSNDTGIAVSAGSWVFNNVVRSNTSYGLALISGGGYGGNVLTGNHGGDAMTQVSGGTQVGTNLCGSDTTCP